MLRRMAILVLALIVIPTITSAQVLITPENNVVVVKNTTTEATVRVFAPDDFSIRITSTENVEDYQITFEHILSDFYKVTITPETNYSISWINKTTLKIEMDLSANTEYNISFDNIFHPSQFCFVVMGDTRPDSVPSENVDPDFLEILKEVKDIALFGINVGDVVGGGGTITSSDVVTQTMFENYYNAWKDKLPIYPVQGNHDQSRDGYERGYAEKLWMNTFGKLNYTFSFGNWTFIAVNTYRDDGTAPDESNSNGFLYGNNWLWLSNVLNSTTGNIVVFQHHNVMDSSNNFCSASSGWQSTQNCLDFINLLESHNVKLDVQGHAHAWRLLERNNTKYLLEGRGGAELTWGESYHGFTIVCVNNSDIVSVTKVNTDDGNDISVSYNGRNDYSSYEVSATIQNNHDISIPVTLLFRVSKYNTTPYIVKGVDDYYLLENDFGYVVVATTTVDPHQSKIVRVYDGSEGWKEYMSFPVEVSPTEHAQYKIVINGATWELYNVTGGLEASGTNDDFWNLVQEDGDDIRIFNQNEDSLYFWIEEWDYANQTATIWVNLTAGSSELNIAYGNPSATKSAYEDPSMVFEFFDCHDTLNYTTYFVDDTETVEIVNGQLHLAVSTNLPFSETGANGKGYNPDALAYRQVDFDMNGSYIFEWKGKIIGTGSSAGLVLFGALPPEGDYIIFGKAYPNGDRWGIGKYDSSGGASLDTGSSKDNNEHMFKVVKNGNNFELYVDDSLQASATISKTFMNYAGFGLWADDELYVDWIRVYKLADPADFGTPVVKLFQKKFGTKTVYVNITYLDTAITERYNPTAYYKLEDKPQITVTSMISVSGVNATYGANISIELIDFVTLDKVVYNGTEVSVTYQGTVTNSTTGYVYNVYSFTTYENGTLEIYGHVGNKAYEATFKLDGETVDVFNVTAVVGEALEITLPHKGNVTLASIEHTGVTSVLINTKDVGVGAKTLTITIDDPENFAVGYRYGTVNIDWGKVYFNITDLQNKTLARTTYGFFNKNFSILSTDPTKLYAGDIEIDVYFHGVKLKSLEIYLNHSNNNLTLNVSVNATQFKDYRNVTRIIASPNYFEVVNLSAKYPFSVMKLVNVSGTVVIDFVSNAPTSVKVEGATSYTYKKPVLKITASGNVTVTDLYRLSIPLKDRLGNPVNFYVLINGSRVDASKGVASKLLKPSWYEVEVPITVAGFELWKFNDSSNIFLVEINTSDKTLPTAEYRVPSKIETKEVRIQKTKFPWLPFPFPFLSKNEPAQEEAPIVRLEGTLRDFYNAPVANRIIKIEVASPNFTRIYNVTTDSSGNFKIEVDMAKGVEYKVTYKFAGDDVYVGTSTTKTFTIEQLLPAPPEEMTIEELLIFVGIAVGLIAVVAGAIYLAKRTKAKTLARMESEFRFFRRLK